MAARPSVPRGPGQREPWTRLAWVPLLALFAGAVYLGLRPGGVAPVLVYQVGPTALGLVAVLGLGSAVAYSAMRRPFLRPGRVAAFAGLSFAVVASSVPFSYPTSHALSPSTVRFVLPLEGEWTVRCGGTGWRENALAFQPARCRGFDFVKRVGGQAFRSDGDDMEDWFGFGDPVLAPAHGRVVAVHDGEEDLGVLDRWSGGEPYGNHVVIEVAPGELLFLTHLRNGSIEVAPGDEVERGRRLASVGSSGMPVISAEPHLGVHVQDRPTPGRAEGIPFFFSDYRVGDRLVERGVPTGGLNPRGTPTGTRVRPVGPPLTESAGPPD